MSSVLKRINWVTGEKINGFSVPKVLNWYLESMGLKGSDYLFP